MSQNAEMLAEIKLFALLNAEEHAFLGARVKGVRFKAGEFGFRYGDPGPSMYGLKSDNVELAMMSVFVLLRQNRQADRDRVHNDVEYAVNLKAEMQMAHIHEKVDDNYAEFQKRRAR